MGEPIVVGVDALLEKFRALKKDVKEKIILSTVKAGAGVIDDAARKNILSQDLVKTGTLKRSIHIETRQLSDDVAEATIGTNLEYAAIHEYGGILRPKVSKYLAVPVGSYKGSPTRHNDLRVRKTRTGNLVLCDRNGTIQYALKKSVEIKAKPYLRPALDENKEAAQQVMADVFNRLVLNAVSEDGE